jgi:hypothetical protein
VVPLLLGMSAGTEAERAAAYHALGAVGGQEIVPPLIDALFDASPRVQRSARRALQRLGALEPSQAPVAAARRPAPGGLRRLLAGGRASRGTR